VSEGGLEPPYRWYITGSVIYHQPKLTQDEAPGPGNPAESTGEAAGLHSRSEPLTCGNGDRTGSGAGAPPGTGLQHLPVILPVRQARPCLRSGSRKHQRGGAAGTRTIPK
jgi:hypothetical protein